MHPFHALLLLFALFGLLAFAFLMRWERRYFQRCGKAGAWLMVRLATIPIALVTVALVILPSRSGMEGLAVFYLMLLTVAPIFWFGAHWMVGKLARPPLTFGETVQIAGTPIVFGLALSAVAHALQPIAWSLLSSAGMV